MKANVEKQDGTYELVEMGDPECGEDFCDSCGDCIHCYWESCASSEYCGGPHWVIYKDNEKNPFKNSSSETK